MNTIFDKIVLNHTDRASVNYAKARCALQEHENLERQKLAKVRASNVALYNRKANALNVFLIEAKVEVIKLLQGKVYPCKKHGRKIEFADGSQAKY